MRKLASVQKVIAVEPIDGADRIVKLSILGWQVVAAKGEFATGDLCVFFEIDSIPPDAPRFKFLWASKDGVADDSRPDKFRLRTKRLRGVISQGLAMPTSIIPDGIEIVEGMDVTELLGVTKWEPPFASKDIQIEGGFPTAFFHKTDEVRIQSVPEIVEELRGVECYTAVKMDGQSLTLAHYMDGGVYTRKVCSRNFALKDIPGSTHWDLARRIDFFNKAPIGFAVQGEFCGPGIQANRLGLRATEFYAFQVYDIVNRKYLDFNKFVEFCNEYGIKTVPIESVEPLHGTVDELLRRAEGEYSNGFPREGLVIRPTVERTSDVISEFSGNPSSRASFKVINNSFLLKIGE